MTAMWFGSFFGSRLSPTYPRPFGLSIRPENLSVASGSAGACTSGAAGAGVGSGVGGDWSCGRSGRDGTVSIMSLGMRAFAASGEAGFAASSEAFSLGGRHDLIGHPPLRYWNAERVDARGRQASTGSRTVSS